MRRLKVFEGPNRVFKLTKEEEHYRLRPTTNGLHKKMFYSFLCDIFAHEHYKIDRHFSFNIFRSFARSLEDYKLIERIDLAKEDVRYTLRRYNGLSRQS